MSKSTYYVWKDNLLEEYFALEKSEMEKNPNYMKLLKEEKSIFYEVDATGFKDAINIHKENMKQKIEYAEEEESSYYFSQSSQTSHKTVLH